MLSGRAWILIVALWLALGAALALVAASQVAPHTSASASFAKTLLDWTAILLAGTALALTLGVLAHRLLRRPKTAA